MPQGIPTEYRGTMFRSRTEARWAYFFDVIGWIWDYEPFDLAGYIPDFLVQGAGEPALIEIKAQATINALADETPKIRTALAQSDWAGHTMIFGAHPWCITEGPGVPRPGLYVHGPSGDTLQPLVWIRCGGNPGGYCGEVAVANEVDGYQAIPCGHYDGDHHLDVPPVEYMQKGWSQARNATQWNPAA